MVSSEALGHENIVYFESPARMHGHERASSSEEGERTPSGHMAARLPGARSSPSAGDELVLGVKTDNLVLFDPQGNRLQAG